ncbi:MAG: DNA primase [Planctomycetota bacterium]
MKFSFDFIERVKQANDIVDVAASYGLTPKKQGRGYVCLCPFHNDHKPSLSLKPDGQYYYCFVCGEGGDVVKFVRKKENLSFVEAVQRLAENARIPLEFDGTPEAGREYAKRSNQKKRLLEINRAAEHWFSEKLNAPSGRAIQSYLVQRGIRQETWTGFGVGYAPKGWTGLLEALTNEGYDGAELEAAGLAAASPDNNRRRDFFMDRVMFPIRDPQGKTIGFSGRQAPGNEFGGKYINTPATALFNKSAALFGVDLAMGAMRERDCAILVEGQLDVLAMHQAGWTNTVAASGSAVTEQHLTILRRLCSRVIVATDGDEAGLKAAERALVPLVRVDLPCRVAVFPEGQDPADILTTEAGPETIRRCLDEAREAFDFKYARLKVAHPSLEVHDTAEIAREMLELFHQTPDALKLQRWREAIALRLGLSPAKLPVPRVELPRPERPERSAPRDPGELAPPPDEPPADFEAFAEFEALDGAEPVSAEARAPAGAMGTVSTTSTSSSTGKAGAAGDSAAGSGAEQSGTGRVAQPSGPPGRAPRPPRVLDRDTQALVHAERDLIWLLLHHPQLMLQAENRIDFYAFLDWRHLVIATGLMLAMQGPSLNQRRVIDAIARAEFDHLTELGEGAQAQSGQCVELAIKLLERKHAAAKVHQETLAEEHLQGAVDALRRLQIRDQLRRIKIQAQEAADTEEKFVLERRKADLMREMVVLGNPETS